jgi:hypothetical protein
MGGRRFPSKRSIATDRLTVRVLSAKHVRRVATMIEKLLAEHLFAGKARLSHIHDRS